MRLIKYILYTSSPVPDVVFLWMFPPKNQGVYKSKDEFRTDVEFRYVPTLPAYVPANYDPPGGKKWVYIEEISPYFNMSAMNTIGNLPPYKELSTAFVTGRNVKADIYTAYGIHIWNAIRDYV